MFAALYALLLEQLTEAIKRKTLAGVFYAVAFTFTLFALASALSALRVWIVRTYDPSFPDLWIAGGLLVISLLFLSLGVWKQRQRGKPHMFQTAAVVAAPVAMRVASRTLTPQLVAIGAIATAGMMLGRSLGRR